MHEAKRTKKLALPRDTSKHQRQEITRKRRMVWEKGLIVGPMEKRTGFELEDTECKQDSWVSQSARDEGGRYTKDWLGTLAIDGSLKEAPGKYAVIGYGIVQLCSSHAGEPKDGEYGTVPAK